MKNKIEDVEGIGPKYREKLQAVGISTTDDFLSKCGTAAGGQTSIRQTRWDFVKASGGVSKRIQPPSSETSTPWNGRPSVVT